MKQKSSTAAAVGGSSLLVIFAVVCFSMLALLSLNTVLAQRRLQQGAWEAELRYAQADLEAETVFARLRAGEAPPEVSREGDRYVYQCPISRYQTLHVQLRETGSGWQILWWQAVAQPEITEEHLPVWEGG